MRILQVDSEAFPKRDVGRPDGRMDDSASRRKNTSQSSGVTTKAEDPDFVSEVVVLGKDSKAEGEKGVRE